MLKDSVFSLVLGQVNLKGEGGSNWERSAYGVQIAVDELKSTIDISEEMGNSWKGFYMSMLLIGSMKV